MTVIDDGRQGRDCPECGEPTKLLLYSKRILMGCDEDQIAATCTNPGCSEDRLEPLVPESEADDFDWNDPN